MVLPYIDMNPPQVYICSPSWTPLPAPSPSHPSGSSQCTSPEHPISCIEPGLAIRFTYIIHVSMPFSQIIPPSSSPTESKRLIYTSVSLLLSCIQGYHYHLSKFHIYALVYCIGVFLSGLHCWWECKLVQPLWRTVRRFLKKLEIELPYDPAIPLLGINTEETRTERDTCTQMFMQHCL